ncbi:serine/threonine-protein kinase [Streptomyces sp. NPDC056672]|uniref:serine/threonine-protein kinase n=1 Tax=Streptomyces sp. NPDC056672 TaxID=3345906 RepID=UPI00368649FC
MADDDPRRVGEYRLLRRLGAGGMGRVYLGRSPGGRMVAVKMVHAEKADAPGFRERFAREVRASQAVSGPGAVPVLAADPDAPVPWLAAAYVPGPTLADAVYEHGPLPVTALWRLLSGLAEALSTVHACGLVHRDLKPSNVLLSLDGPLLIDFGIARAADEPALTRTGLLVGSVGYMSPEQVQMREVHGASDVFSLGVVLAFAAMGRDPFGTGPWPLFLYRVVHEEPDLSNVPEDLMAVVRDCLAKEPEHRPSPEELRARAEEHGTDAAHWLPAPIASAMALLAEQLRNLEAPDGDTGPGHSRGKASPRAAASPPVGYVPTARVVPTAQVVPPSGFVPPGGVGDRSGFAGPTYSSPPPPTRPPSSMPSLPSVGLAEVPTRSPGPPGQVWVAPLVRRSLLGHPLLSLLGLTPMFVLLVTGSEFKAHAREHPEAGEETFPVPGLITWAMDDDGWRVPLTVLLIVVLVGLQYFRARLERYPVVGTRIWTAAIGGFWLLWSVMVPLTLLWVMGVAESTEENLTSEWFRNVVAGTWWVLAANMLAVPFMAVAAVIRLLRGLFGDVARSA